MQESFDPRRGPSPAGRGRRGRRGRRGGLGRWRAAALTGVLTAASLPVGSLAAEPKRETAVTVYGDERCPAPGPDEVVVCAREPEEERFRIPQRLRERATDRAVATAWGARVEAAEEGMRFTRPGGCSPVGSDGQTGCTAASIRQWFADRRARQAEEAAVP